MAYADDLAAIRDNLVAELKGETARRAAIVAAGNPPPATYTVNGKTVDWTGYMNMMLARIKEANDMVQAAGGDGGLYEEIIRGVHVSFAATVANDYRVTDDTAAVTFTSRSTGSAVNLSLTHADAHEFTSEEIAASNGYFGVGDRRWSLPNNQIAAAYKPRPGDEITDPDGVRWEILSAVLDDFGISWTCVAKKAR